MIGKGRALDGNTVLLVGLRLSAAALLLVIAEVFLPSAGLLSIGAGAAAIAGMMVLFKHPDGPTWGPSAWGLCWWARRRRSAWP